MKSRELYIAYSVRRDQDLWQDLCTGDRNALDYIYYSQVPALLAYGRHLTPDSTLVDDCVQDLFVDLWIKRDRLGAVRTIRFYLMKALKHRIVRELQNQKKRRSLTESEGAFEDQVDPNPFPPTGQYQPTSAVMECLNKLSPLQKEIVYLKYFNGLTFDEIGDILELDKKQLYNALSKAMHNLRGMLKLAVFIVLLIY
ncbi:RNA polymerase sigma factor [Marinoscillum sp.]|uniref:RNA polymerase sigma factor n=1 Tax=Marinoscillum sp. TaxID=2024838 RepID=UPI003BACDF65